MSDNWHEARLGDVIKYRKEFIVIDDLTTYKRPRVQLHAQGIVLRDEIPGALIKTKDQQICHAGEFLVAEIDAKVGGFGIVPESLDGSIVSSHYFIFVIEDTKLDRRFLDYFVRTPAFRKQVEAQGSTNYAAIRPSHVLNYDIPLPPLTEQRRIVTRIENLATKMREARALRQQTRDESAALIVSARGTLFGDKVGPKWIPLSHFVAAIETGKSPQCEPRPANEHEWGVLKVGAISFGSFDERENKALPIGVAFDSRHEVHAGDFLMSRANTTELVGACAIVYSTRPQLLLSDKTFRFNFQPNAEILPQWLDDALKSPALREQIEHRASGTSPTMKNISQEKALRLLLPPHELSEQRQIVHELNGLRTQVDRLQHLQAETATELDALLPSILDKAFRGEL
jgi:type I restriction enzyme S subunit